MCPQAFCIMIALLGIPMSFHRHLVKFLQCLQSCQRSQASYYIQGWHDSFPSDAIRTPFCRTNKELKKAEADVQKTDTLVTEACSKIEAEKQEVERRLQAAQRKAEENLREAKQAEAELASYKVVLAE